MAVLHPDPEAEPRRVRLVAVPKAQQLDALAPDLADGHVERTAYTVWGRLHRQDLRMSTGAVAVCWLTLCV